MVWLGDECEGGGTRFPRLSLENGGRGDWCRFVECGEGKGGEEEDKDEDGEGEGVTLAYQGKCGFLGEYKE